MQAHADEQVHVADDGEHILGEVLFIQAHRRVVRKLRRDVAADLAVLFIVERDEHGLRVVLVLHHLDRAQKLFDKAAVCVPLTDGPADS